VHRNGGARNLHYGPSLASQLRAITPLSKKAAAAEVQSGISFFKVFPNTLPILAQFEATGTRMMPVIHVTYEDPSNPLSAWIEIH
jgi:hypothetical protein